MIEGFLVVRGKRVIHSLELVLFWGNFLMPLQLSGNFQGEGRSCQSHRGWKLPHQDWRSRPTSNCDFDFISSVQL